MNYLFENSKTIPKDLDKLTIDHLHPLSDSEKTKYESLIDTFVDKHNMSGNAASRKAARIIHGERIKK